MSTVTCPIRPVADICMAITPLILCVRVWCSATGSGSGSGSIPGLQDVSAETAILSCLVYVLRYLDAFNGYSSTYNQLMKIWLVSATLVSTLVLLSQYSKLSITRTRIYTSGALIAVSVILGLLFNYTNSYYGIQNPAIEICWAISQYLSATAFLPQYMLLHRSSAKEPQVPTHKLTLVYLTISQLGRALYLPHWIVRRIREGQIDPIAITSTSISTAFFLLWSALYLVGSTDQQQKHDIRLPRDCTDSVTIQINPEADREPEREPLLSN